MAAVETIRLPLLNGEEQYELILPKDVDARELFEELCHLNPDARLELTEEGHILVIPPTGMEGGYQSGEVFSQLSTWAKRNRTGKAFDSNSGFYLSEKENRAPDASWVANARIKSVSKRNRRKFAPFCPDFAIEVKSPSEALSALERKCARYVQEGAFESWLINPEQKAVTVFRPGSVQVHQDVAEVSGSGPLADFTLDLTEVWRGLDDEALE